MMGSSSSVLCYTCRAVTGGLDILLLLCDMNHLLISLQDAQQKTELKYSIHMYGLHFLLMHFLDRECHFVSPMAK